MHSRSRERVPTHTNTSSLTLTSPSSMSSGSSEPSHTGATPSALTTTRKSRKLSTFKRCCLFQAGSRPGSWVTATRPRAPTVPQGPSKSHVKDSIMLPYVGHLTDTICRIMHKAGIKIHVKPFNMIRSHLVHPKDKVKKVDKMGMVYHIQCSD